MWFAEGHHVYNLSGRAVPDPSGTYRSEITLANEQVVTASFGLKNEVRGYLANSVARDSRITVTLI
jgi:hypothetical protein